MKRLAVGILVALLTFLTGMFASALWHPSGFRNCVVAFSDKDKQTLAEEEIAKTVFRHQIQQLFSDAESPAFFLSVNNDSDPSEDVLMVLQREGLQVRQLSQLGMRRAFYFIDCNYCPDLPAEFILRLGRIRWLKDDEVLVGSSCRRWSLNADRAYLYHVVLEKNRWVVKDYEVL